MLCPFSETLAFYLLQMALTFVVEGIISHNSLLKLHCTFFVVLTQWGDQRRQPSKRLIESTDVFTDVKGVQKSAKTD